jgi:hypothetical protein
MTATRSTLPSLAHQRVSLVHPAAGDPAGVGLKRFQKPESPARAERRLF